MAGFACLLNRRGAPIAPGLVEAVAASIAHRGPDGVTATVAGPIATIHAALHSTPESIGERQPYTHPSGTVYVGDVRLDNRPELTEALGSTRPGRDCGDIELIAAAHQRWGRDVASHLVGDFAFVAVEPSGRLECYRDHMGIKPVYYWQSSDWFVIASEIRQIGALDGGPSTIDVGMAGEFLSGVVDDPVRTIIAGVNRLPAAHGLEFDGDCRTRRYWRPALDEPIILGARGAYIERFRELFDDAVEARVRAPGPIGSQLSGGLDSTSVTAAAARNHHDVRALSCLFPGAPRTDERPFIDAAVELLGDDVSWCGVVDDVDRQPWVDDDVAFSSDIPLPPDGPVHVDLGRKVVASGGRVVLTGHGGDHWLDASPYVLPDLLSRGRLGAAWRLASADVGGGPVTVGRALIGHAFRWYKPDWVRRPGESRAPWVVGPARVGADLDRRRVPSRVPIAYRDRKARLLDQINSSGYEAMTRTMLDRIAASAGVEARHPYLDRRLMEFAARVPASVHAEPGRQRTLQRDALADLLPAGTVERRSKASFSEVWWQEIQRHTPPDGLGSGRVAQLGWVDRRLLEAAVERTSAAMQARAGAGQSLALWGVIQVEALVRRLDAAVPARR